MKKRLVATTASLALCLSLTVQSAEAALDDGSADGLQQLASGQGGAGDRAESTEATSETAARLAAVLQGKRVEVLSARTEDSTTWALPVASATAAQLKRPAW
ncbi:hypothetical protein [Streptomyces sp. NPDC002788]